MNVSKISKYMSLLLRHNPEKENLTMDKYGWVSTKQLVQALNITMDELKVVVETNNKKRFELTKNEAKIRACQGHSIDIVLGIKPTQPPVHLYHGTDEKNKMAILTEGLVKMNRNHVHLSEDLDTAYDVGKRHGNDTIILKVNSGAMFNDGVKFYLSKNGVWLCDYIDPKYIELNM